jgi:hypothetical protein
MQVIKLALILYDWREKLVLLIVIAITSIRLISSIGLHWIV